MFVKEYQNFNQPLQFERNNLQREPLPFKESLPFKEPLPFKEIQRQPIPEIKLQNRPEIKLKALPEAPTQAPKTNVTIDVDFKVISREVVDVRTQRRSQRKTSAKGVPFQQLASDPLVVAGAAAAILTGLESAFSTDPRPFSDRFTENIDRLENPDLYRDRPSAPWQWPELKLPEFPQLKLPEFPQLKLPEWKWPEFPQLKLPEFPQLKLPEWKWPDWKWPQLPKPKFPALPEFPPQPKFPEKDWPWPEPNNCYLVSLAPFAIPMNSDPNKIKKGANPPYEERELWVPPIARGSNGPIFATYKLAFIDEGYIRLRMENDNNKINNSIDNKIIPPSNIDLKNSDGLYFYTINPSSTNGYLGKIVTIKNVTIDPPIVSGNYISNSYREETAQFFIPGKIIFSNLLHDWHQWKRLNPDDNVTDESSEKYALKIYQYSYSESSAASPGNEYSSQASTELRKRLEIINLDTDDKRIGKPGCHPWPEEPPAKKKEEEEMCDCCDEIKLMRKMLVLQQKYIEDLMLWTGAHHKMKVQRSLVTPPPKDWDFTSMAVDFMMDPTGAAATAIRNWAMDWWNKPPEIIELNSIPEIVNWLVENFYSFLGEFGFNVDIPIQIAQNSEGETETITSDTQTIHIPNIAIAIKQILMLLINLQDDETRLKSIGLRALLSSRLAQESSIRNEYLSQAILDVLGYPTKQESLAVPCPFNLNERGEYNINQDDAELDTFLQNSYTYLPITKAAGETDLKDDLRPLLEAASVIMAQFATRVPGGVTDEVMREVLRGVVRNYMNKRPQTGSEDFGTFLNKAEQGFSTEGVTDPLNPYGRNFEERPRIRDLKAENQENQT